MLKSCINWLLNWFSENLFSRKSRKQTIKPKLNESVEVKVNEADNSIDNNAAMEQNFKIELDNTNTTTENENSFYTIKSF